MSQEIPLSFPDNTERQTKLETLAKDQDLIKPNETIQIVSKNQTPRRLLKEGRPQKVIR